MTYRNLVGFIIGLALGAFMAVCQGQTYKASMSVTYASLPTTGLYAGMEMYVTNCRAITGVTSLSGGFSTQASGAGTGCLAVYSGSAWQIAGTTMTVSQ